MGTNGSDSGSERLDCTQDRQRIGILVQLTLDLTLQEGTAGICWILFKRQAL